VKSVSKWFAKTFNSWRKGELTSGMIVMLLLVVIVTVLVIAAFLAFKKSALG